MKKIITLISASFLIASSALAGGMIGVKYGVGELEGTQNAYTAGSTTYAAQTKSEDSEYGAIFAEVELPQVDGLSLGIEYVPYTATITVDGNSSDSHLELSDYTTIYGLYSQDVGGVNAYFKGGYSIADIGNVKANYTSTTVNSHDDNLEGIMLGVGVQADIAALIGRAEVTYTDFDTVKVNTTSNGSAAVDKTGDAELLTFSVSIAKSF
ncbi:hypothetical protein [Candidatus Pelagibacter sp. HIMB1483]|uniref:hypothetical protein n=1 Tax=Candidatus Pelagibacter sp. HIMB1483 TaxID=3415414 RepID=UPI003F848D7F